MKILNILFGIIAFSGSYGDSSFIFPCYYYYEPDGLAPEKIPNDLCTHIVHIGCVDQTNLIAEPYRTTVDCTSVFQKMSKLREQNPNLTLIMSMGATEAMEKVVVNPILMQRYIDSAVNLVQKYNYQGIDFDWEFPCGQYKPLFTKFLQMLRLKVGNSLLITAAIGAPLDILVGCYELDGLSAYLDYIHVMCYNYNTIYNKRTAYSQPLYQRPEEKGYDATLNTNFTINYLLENNVPKEKIVVGLSADGHTFQLSNKNKNGFHAPVNGIGCSSGWSTLPRICKMINNGGVYLYDEIAEALYVTYDDQWANCGDVRSAIAKSKWVKQNQLAGVFTWALNIDDIENECGYNTEFPLHTAIRRTLFNEN